MKTSSIFARFAFLAFQSSAHALSIAEINGNKFLSPYAGQNVTSVTGLVTAKGSSGIWLRSTTPDNDVATSDSLFVFSSTVGKNISVGDIISLDGKVSEFRSSPDFLYLTELGSPRNVQLLSSNNAVVPKVIGVDTLPPPTVQYSALDGGDIYGLPAAVTNISIENPVLDPTQYGLDFWESLTGELVTVRAPTVLGRPNNFRETWVVGDWPTTGRNSHGGLTMTDKGQLREIILCCYLR